MRAHPKLLAALLTTSAALALAPGLALAQESPPAAAPPSASPNAAGGTGEATLGEVVVTATRRNDTVNRVALSMTAETQRSLDQQGVRNVQDLSRVVPALTIRRSDNNNIQPAIRGIIASGGAPTTGVYLDDTPLQKRNGTAPPSATAVPSRRCSTWSASRCCAVRRGPSTAAPPKAARSASSPPPPA